MARLAGLPTDIITRAREILSNLERGEFDDSGAARLSRRAQEGVGVTQMGLFAPAESRVIEELRTFEVDRMTPVEALNTLARMVARLRGTLINPRRSVTMRVEWVEVCRNDRDMAGSMHGGRSARLLRLRSSWR